MHTYALIQTLHSVCRIAEVLLALQQKGNVKYTRWELNFHCAVDMVDTLQQQAKDMEEELQAWEDQVWQTREQYYELNYYTTLQLLTLRKELGRLKSSGQLCTQISPHVLALLECISTEIASPDVLKVVKNVTAKKQGGGGGEGGRGGTSQFLTQEEITANVTGPTTQVIDSALEKFGEDQYEVRNWIFENTRRYEVESAGIDREEMESGSDSELESDPDMPLTTPPLQSHRCMWTCCNPLCIRVNKYSFAFDDYISLLTL